MTVDTVSEATGEPGTSGDGVAIRPSGLFGRFPSTPITTSIQSLQAAQVIEASSKRRVDTPIRKGFVRADDDTVPPLARIYVGGRSGTVAVKLYLALLWRCAAPPFSTNKPARAWATLLDLPDPEGAGARRVSAALKSLKEASLITITRQDGAPNLVTLLDERGNDQPYEIPSSAYTLARARGRKADQLWRNLYFKLSTSLWTEGLIQTLSGPGLVLLLILLAEQGGNGKEIWISPPTFAQRYKISPKTRTAGTKELERIGLLRIDRQRVTSNPNGTVFDRVRYRNVYRLAPIAQVDQGIDQAWADLVASLGTDPLATTETTTPSNADESDF